MAWLNVINFKWRNLRLTNWPAIAELKNVVILFSILGWCKNLSGDELYANSLCQF